MTTQPLNHTPNIVFGKVTDKQNSPLASLIVKVYDKDMRSMQLLADTVTNKKGDYKITWLHSQLSGRGRGEADISIRVFQKGDKTPLFESDIDSVVFNASPSEEINISIENPGRPSVVEYDYIFKKITFLADKIAISELQENKENRDITFLSKESGIDANKIEHLVIASRLQLATKIPAPFFYAMLRKNTFLKSDIANTFTAQLSIGINYDVQILLYRAALTDGDIIETDLKSAVKEKLVALAVAKDTKRNIEMLQKYKRAARDYFEKDHSQKAFDTVVNFVAEGKTGEMTELFREHKNDLNAFLEKITDRSFFSVTAKKETARTQIAMGKIFGFGSDVIPKVMKSQKIEKPEDVKKLARLNKKEWVEELIKAKAGEKESINTYASMVVRKLEKEYPTIAFTAQLQREKKPVLKNQDAIVSFLTKHGDFDLAKHNIDAFLKEKSITKKITDPALNELSAVQRIFKLVPVYSKTNGLRNQNFTSSQAITAAGQKRFIEEIAPAAGIDKKEAKEIFKKAEAISAVAMMVATELHDLSGTRDVTALASTTLGQKLETISGNFPNLKTLFNLTDTCACEHCRSVYSPAAYLVEILQFLKNCRTVSGVSRDLLFFHTNKNGSSVPRRKDLGDIDLSCENANTPIPYIDLVCELLEEAIIPDAGVNFTGNIFAGVSGPTGVPSAGLITALQAENIPITAAAMIYGTETGEQHVGPPYFLRDKKAVCKIENTGGSNYKVFQLRQTLSTAEELAAAPEYVNTEVYKLLSNQLSATMGRCDFAFSLPFDLNHVEARAYFDRFNISRAELMEQFKVDGSPPNRAIAAEKLGLTEAERALIVTPNPSLAKQQQIWNTPTVREDGTSINVVDYMERVDHFLDKTRLTFKELDLFLTLKFIDPAKNLFVKNLDNSCNTEQKQIEHLSAAVLDRVHRFLRLQKKIAWKFDVLDEIVSQFGLNDSGIIKAAALVEISEKTGIKIDELIGFYGTIPYEKRSENALVPLYYKIFLNKAKNGFIEEGLSVEHVLDNQRKMANPPSGWTSAKISQYKTAICSCLQLSVQELDSLILAEPEEEKQTLTFENLSFLFAASTLAKKLKLKGSDFTALYTITSKDAFQSPQSTVAFIEEAEALKKAPLKAGEVKFYIRPTAENFPDIEEKINKILEAVQKIRRDTLSSNTESFQGLLVIDEEMIEQQKEAVQNELFKLSGLADEHVKMFMRIIERDWALESEAVDFVRNKLTGLSSTQVTAITDKISALNTADSVTINNARKELLDTLLTILITDADELVALTALSVEQKIAKVQNCLLALENVTSADALLFINFLEFKRIDLTIAKQLIADRLEYEDRPANKKRERFDTTLINQAVEDFFQATNTGKKAKQQQLLIAMLGAISSYQLWADRQAGLTQTISTGLKAEKALAEVVLKYARLTQTSADVLRDLLLANSLDDSKKALRLLYRILPFINTFKLSANEIEWYFVNSKKCDWLQWDEIPYTTSLPPVPFKRYLNLAGIIDLAKQFKPVTNPSDPENPITFYTLAFMLTLSDNNDNEHKDRFFELMALLTGYNKNDLVAIDARLFNQFSLKHYCNAKTWNHIFWCAEALRKMVCDVPQVLQYVKPVLTGEDVKYLRASLKSRYEETVWLSTLKEISDAVRPQKRNALVAYLLAVNPDMKDANDLYDYFLIDTQMEAKMPSSRIVQAHGTIQLFVQRCLMGLEPGVVADTEAGSTWNQWKWMKNYRVWEANRKVFLYPENWIEAELRDDKSFLFTEFENEIRQNELTDFTAEEALKKYLEKLDNIAFLEVMASWYETGKLTMHILARTKGGDPASYYYRKFEKERSWTPWEKVELDISGNHLIAFVRNNRLSLAWPIFTEIPELNPKVIIPDRNESYELPVNGPKKKFKIQLAISEYVNNKWQPKKVSADGILTPSDFSDVEGNFERDKYFLAYFPLPKIKDLPIGDVVCLFTPGEKAERNGSESKTLQGVFNIAGCKGYPELLINQISGSIPDILPDFNGTLLRNQKYIEQASNGDDDLSVRNGITILNSYDFKQVLQSTPGAFRISFPHQFTKMDLPSLIYQAVALAVNSTGQGGTREFKNTGYKIPMGTLLPYFVEDSNHAYVIIPGYYKKTDDAFLVDDSKRTASDVIQLMDKILVLWEKYSAAYEHDINKNLDVILEELIKDPQFSAVFNELAMFEGFDLLYSFLIANGRNANFDKKLEELKRSSGLVYGEQFKNLYHPLVCTLRSILYNNSTADLMKRGTQLLDTKFSFADYYNPNPEIVPQTSIPQADGSQPASTVYSYPVEDVDFKTDGSYSSYNWELFFHIPFLLATRLTANQRFEEALTWFHYIFNPTGALTGSGSQKYWVTKAFYMNQATDYQNSNIDILLGGSLSDTVITAIEEWRKNPFKPHAVAKLRPVAYQKALLMKYLDNLLEWGDYLFRQDTMESITQATQMYILADKLLGPNPRIIPPLVSPPYETYNQLEHKLDAFGNALIEMENLIPVKAELPEGGAELPGSITFNLLYFGIPKNDKMLGYWDRISERLFNIRNSRNIDGVERSLSLFAPPIDPAMLVRAAAAGLDISAVLAGINAPTPYYRFNVISQKATELAQEVRGLGSSLLQALEKQDAEVLSLLRSELEMKVLNAVKDLKLLQIREAKEQIEILQRTKLVTTERFKYYSTIEKINSKEQLSLDKLRESHDYNAAAQGVKLAASLISLLPDINLGASGFGGSPLAAFKIGGLNLGQASNAASDILSFIGMLASNESSRASILGGYDRRFQDWKLQERTAQKELDGIDRQIVAAEIRKEISETDLKNHELQIENAKKTDEFMRSKFTNKELYDWMIGQISSVYFSAYQLAHDFAKKAERSYRFELGNEDTFIANGYWDSMKKGLQSADRLIHDIKRMETSYLDKNKREYELTKHVSLALLDPLALTRLRETGICDFDIPEALFDMDHAGHYFRRVKSISISMPCIAGPYTSISAKLSQINNRYRKNTNQDNPAATGYAEDPGNDERFVYNTGAIQSIATSSAQNDSGIFELNFRDERYLPFEGTGAISSWRLELPKVIKQFAYNTISDAIIHIKYTAREGGSSLKALAENSLMERLALVKQQLGQNGLHVAINMKHDMPNEWQLLRKNEKVNLKIEKGKLPYMAQLLKATIDNVVFVAGVDKDSSTNPGQILVETSQDASEPDKLDTINLAQISGWPTNIFWGKSAKPIVADTSFKLSCRNLEELTMLVKYSFS